MNYILVSAGIVNNMNLVSKTLEKN